MLKPTVDEIVLEVFSIVILVTDIVVDGGWQCAVLGGMMMFIGIASYLVRVFLKKN